MREWVKRATRMRPVRAWLRFGQVRGNLLAAGIAFFAFFSLFPALALAAVVVGFVLRGRPDVLDAVGQALDRALPGFVRTSTHPEGVLELSVPEPATLSVAGVVAVVGLLVGGLGWVGSMREGIRTVLGAPGSPGTLLTDKLRDLGVFVLLGASVVVSAALAALASGLGAVVAEWLGAAGGSFVVGTAGVLVAFAVNVAVLVLLLRVLSGVRLPGRAVRSGALAGAVGLTLLQTFGTQVVALGTRNPLFGSIVLVVGLLFWLHVVARVVLVAAAWAADVSAPAPGSAPADPAAGPATGSPTGRVDALDERARARHGIPAVGRRSADCPTLAVGVVLGAAAVGALGAVRRARATSGRGPRGGHRSPGRR